jgi:hypothetical protein
MTASDVERPDLKRVEPLLTTCLILLKLDVLYASWAELDGFDAEAWLDVFRATHWFQPLPAPTEFFASYHPPLSYLACRLIYAAYPHEVEASQILSTAAMIIAVLTLRWALRTIGILWTLPGLTMFYVASSVPLLVFLAMETGYDSLVFMWFCVTFAISVALFWAPTPATWWRKPRYAAGVLILGFALAGALLTKFNGSIFCGLPFLIILVRRGVRGLWRELAAPLAAGIIAIALVARLYYTRYYLPLGELFPVPIRWLRPEDLAQALALRDADRWGFLRNVLRIPKEPIVGTQEPVRDSIIHSVWLQTWKRDAGLGAEAPLALVFSDLYLRTITPIVLASTGAFLVRGHRLPRSWRDLGYALLALTVIFWLALFYFGWKYPMWDWEVFKAKYIVAAVLWIPYCVALPVLVLSGWSSRTPRRERLSTDAVVLLLVLFMFANHLLRVY